MGIGTASPNSTLGVDGSVSKSIQVLTAITNITLDETHHTLVINATVASVTLPSASDCYGRVYILVNRTNTTRTISVYHTLAGATSNIIPANSSLTVQSDGANWYAINYLP